MTAKTTHTRSSASREQQNDAAPLSILAAWEKVFRAYLVKARLAKDVIKADLTLSLQALIASAICLMTLVGIGLLIWITLLLTLGYGLYTLGAHWLFIPITFVVVNVALLCCTYGIFKRVKRSININASVDMFSDND
ncbi:hypothetical protein [Paraglaciecola marina]|uniref:hypothetical protein n=1 Tax=Paraglaciecola marina TaxID=2500157 RepID=UPI00105B879E|nr:hypothetical protein [Paraglaciecola marina]